MVPELMTFKGRNYDILVGISALLVGLLVFKKHVSTQGLLLWNVVGLFFVCFILINGILSAELPFQQFAFDQPNRALSYFPYVFLPAIVVPIVIYTHITDIMKLKSIQLEKDII
jgi:branched-subunit amino acid transport protein